jgi:predicted nucleotidyltransferase
MLIEVARRQKDFVPELSFGTHFFQDLVEASIRYLPLYPDDAGVVFNEGFLTGAPNMLASLVPEDAGLSDVLHVVDVSSSAPGQMLQVLMNGDQDEAVGILAEPVTEIRARTMRPPEVLRQEAKEESHWRWRLQSAERLAADMNPARFGVKALYVFGSTKNGTAGPQSDIDLLIHFQGTEEQRKELMAWLEGWSLSLSHLNFLRTGYKTERLLDVHIVTDQDLEGRTSFAVKIGAITDSARPLPMGKG